MPLAYPGGDGGSTHIVFREVQCSFYGDGRRLESCVLQDEPAPL